MDERARKGLEVGVGLALLGVQRWMSLRPDIEEELDRLGYGLAADISRKVGATVSSAVARLASSAGT
ncbi:MAG: hypothetical protein IT196_22240 [Acidimicrobiales bacterium]|nr:hypothetical protein [Acidimicrobiales bacterium]